MREYFIDTDTKKAAIKLMGKFGDEAIPKAVERSLRAHARNDATKFRLWAKAAHYINEIEAQTAAVRWVLH